MFTDHTAKLVFTQLTGYDNFGDNTVQEIALNQTELFGNFSETKTDFKIELEDVKNFKSFNCTTLQPGIRIMRGI